jgi:hypothetical protein
MSATNRKELQGAGEDLTPKQEKAIVALLSEGTTKAAAEKAGVNEATLWRWLQLPEFQSCYRALRRQLVEVAISELQSNASAAVRRLRTIIDDDKAPVSSQVAAARIIIEQSIVGIEKMDLVERMDNLEAWLEAEKKRGKK